MTEYQLVNDRIYRIHPNNDKDVAVLISINYIKPWGILGEKYLFHSKLITYLLNGGQMDKLFFSNKLLLTEKGREILGDLQNNYISNAYYVQIKWIPKGTIFKTKRKLIGKEYIKYYHDSYLS